jgi:uncharacterized membrane protein
MHGLTVAEIAVELGISIAAAKKRLSRAEIKPISYAGPTAIYAPSALKKIRDTLPRGRPKRLD